MNKENVQFLYEGLKYLGFGEHFIYNGQLEEAISKDPKDFTLFTEAYFEGDCKLETTLYFRRSDHIDMYFFNKYDAVLIDESKPDPEKRQTFFINKGNGVTMKEAFNLLQGRSVNKDLTNFEGERYNAWIQLNFEEKDLNNNHKMRQYRRQYGFNLEKALENYPIRELKHEEMKAGLIKSLRRGNLQLVTFVKPNKMEKMFIEANPRFKTINIYPYTDGIGQAQAKAVPDPPEQPGTENDIPVEEDEVELPKRIPKKKNRA
jgi:hypothetical protein